MSVNVETVDDLVSSIGSRSMSSWGIDLEIVIYHIQSSLLIIVVGVRKLTVSDKR
jgi:hypothetical protein